MQTFPTEGKTYGHLSQSPSDFDRKGVLGFLLRAA